MTNIMKLKSTYNKVEIKTKTIPLIVMSKAWISDQLVRYILEGYNKTLVD